MAAEIQKLLWDKLLELTEIEINEVNPSLTLDELGLDSNDAIVLAMEIEELLGKEIDVAVFMRFETIDESFQEIERQYL